MYFNDKEYILSSSLILFLQKTKNNFSVFLRFQHKGIIIAYFNAKHQRVHSSIQMVNIACYFTVIRQR